MSERASWTVKEYADRHSISTRTVWRLIKAKRLHVLRFGPRTVRIVSRKVTDSDPIGQEATS